MASTQDGRAQSPSTARAAGDGAEGRSIVEAEPAERPAEAGDGGLPAGGEPEVAAEVAARRRSLAERVRLLSPRVVFLALAVPMGLFLLLAVPPTQGLDEPNHFYRAYGISMGQLVAETQAGRTGGFLPSCLPAYINFQFKPAGTPDRFHPSTFLYQPKPCTSKRSFLEFPNTALYSLVSYAPQSLALLVTRSLRFPLPLQFYAGRLAAFTAFILLAWTALKIAPWGHSVMLLVAAWPMALLGAASYSADTMALALSLVLVACVLRAREDSQGHLRWFLVGAAAAVALGLSKSTYFVLAPLLLLVPNDIAPSRLLAMLLKVGAIAVVAVTSAAWTLSVRGIHIQLPPGGGTIDPIQQLALILAHPVHYVNFMLGMLLGSQVGYFTWETFVTQIGFFRSFANGTPFPQPWVMVAGYLAVVFAYIGVSTRPWLLSTGRVIVGLFPPVLILVNIVLIFTVLYLAATPVGGNLLTLDGRYLLPFVSVPLISLSILQRGHHPARWNVFPVILILVMYVGLFLKTLSLFYGIA